MKTKNPMLEAKGGTTMSVGTISGDPVLKFLISSVAANTQALEKEDDESRSMKLIPAATTQTHETAAVQS